MPEYTPPEDVHAPQIAAQIQKLAQDIHRECSASKIVVHCAFTLDGKTGKGRLKLRMEVSDDAVMERAGKERPLPRGTKVILDAEKKAAALLKRYGGSDGKAQ